MKILFVCVANSARSQLAEGMARAMAPPGIEVLSAGSRPTSVREEAVRVLEEIGIDIRGQRSKGFSEIALDSVDLVVTLCAEEVCPVVPTRARVLAWPQPDPAAVDDAADRLKRFREVRDAIRTRIAQLFADLARVPHG